MKNVFEVDKETIKDYWESRPPQVWYSSHEPLTLPWFNELAYKRYHDPGYLSYLLSIAEFDAHPGEKVLEIGTGVGTDLVSYARGGARVTGIDLTENAVKITQAHLEMLGLEYDDVRVADAEELPFEDGSFDVVFSCGVLHHTPRIDKTLDEVYRVLKPNGKAIIILYARGWKHWVKRIFIKGILGGQLLRNSYQSVINRNTEVHGGSPLSYVMTTRRVKKLFRSFGDVSITRYRLGEYFDYAPYNTRRLPFSVKNILYLLRLEQIIGEIHGVTARKDPPPQERVNVFQTLLRP